MTPSRLQPDADPVSDAVRLKVLVVGSGIAGLTAATALRQQGHEVHVYEQSQSGNETGAAIHLSPNANSVLRRLGIRHEQRGAVKLLHTRYYDSTCRLLSHVDNDAQSHRWQEDWLMTHRGHLHAHIKETATDVQGEGIPAEIHTSSRVASVDPRKATITLANGDCIEGDVLIGADGVRSVCRNAVAGPKYESFELGKNAFRFMVSRAEILKDPLTRALGEAVSTMDFFFSPENKVIVYPCVNNTLLNVVCIHPSRLSSATSDSYNKPVFKEKLLSVFSEFNPTLLRLFDKCDSDTLKVWPLWDAPTMPTFVQGRLALMGDAAHAFTPFIGQGGAMAIEDAASLGIMLSRGVTVSEIKQRVELYNVARYERATTIQDYSRVAGGDGVKPGEEEKAQLQSRDHALFALSHDEHHASTQILREHQWTRLHQAVWRQPTVFGPLHASSRGITMDGPIEARITFKTSATLLRNLFPNKSYSFAAKDTVALATLCVRSQCSVQGLGGYRSNEVRLEVHGVIYTRADGSVVRGRYVPVVFEDSADAISAHREEWGYPSVFADIMVDATEKSYSATLSWKRTEWATVWLKDLFPLPKEEDDSLSHPEENLLVNERTPNIGGETCKGGSDTEQDIVICETGASRHIDGQDEEEHFNHDTVLDSDSSIFASVNADFQIKPTDAKSMPTLHHIVSRLAELPVFGVVDATLQRRDNYQHRTGVYAIG